MTAYDYDLLPGAWIRVRLGCTTWQLAELELHGNITPYHSTIIHRALF
jgi:hypothetical protein